MGYRSRADGPNPASAQPATGHTTLLGIPPLEAVWRVMPALLLFYSSSRKGVKPGGGVQGLLPMTTSGSEH